MILAFSGYLHLYVNVTCNQDLQIVHLSSRNRNLNFPQMTRKEIFVCLNFFFELFNNVEAMSSR